MQEPKLDVFELHIADRADDPPVSLPMDKQLLHPFIRQLPDPFVQLFGLEGIPVDELLEDLRGKTRNTLEGEMYPLCQRIADLEVSRIVQPHHVSGPGLFDNALLVRHEAGRIAEPEFLVETSMIVVLVPLEPAGADPAEGDAV